MANKLTGGGFLVTGIGWLSSTTNIALVGLFITVLGGVWSFMAFLRNRSDAKAKRAEEAEEHAARMRLLELEIAKAGGQ